MAGCAQSDAFAVRCTRCPSGFFHYECLVNVAAAVANTALDGTLCVACARAHVLETEREAALGKGRGKTRQRSAGPSCPPVKRVHPQTDVPCGTAKRRATGKGWCPAGINHNCASTPSVVEEEACSDWHIQPESSSKGSNDTPGMWIGHTRRKHNAKCCDTLWPSATPALLTDTGSSCAQPVVPMSRARLCPTCRHPTGLGACIPY